MKASTKKVLGIIAAILGVGGLVFGVVKLVEAKKEYCCPYCPECFATYEELVEHVKTVHPGERIPLPIEWD